MNRALVFAVPLVTVAGYLIYANSDNEGVLALPENADASMSQTNDNSIKAHGFNPYPITIDIDEGELDAVVADEDGPLHIGEYIDPDDLHAIQGGEPVHIGKFVDPDALIYEGDDETIHIGEDLSAYDPMEYTIEEDVGPLNIGEDLSAYEPSETPVSRGNEPARHEGDIVYDL